MKALSIAFSFSVLALPIAHAADDSAQPAIAPVTTVDPAAVTATGAFFAKPVFLRGTLGDAAVQFNLRPKAVADEGLEGEYFVFGSSNKILLAGEVEGDALFLEESENGTDISGQWDGKLQGDALVGNWTSADGAISRPFSLKIIALKETAAATKRAKKTFNSISK